MSLKQVEYYYDSHRTAENLLGETERQDTLSRHLVEVLRWLYHGENWYIPRNPDLHRADDYHGYPRTPDVAVFKGSALPDDPDLEIKSWRVHDPADGPPDLVFEPASDENRKKDVSEKPDWYAEAGVKEYFFYEPRPQQKVRGPRLRGWRGVRRGKQGQAEPMEPGQGGRIWSEELKRWIVPDGRYLRLVGRAERQRLTEAEAERAARERAWAKLPELGIEPETL